MPDPSAADRILAAVRELAAGQVASYGGIARRAGLPGRARMVARVLGRTEDPALPWHRVLRSDGRIAFPKDSAGYREQVRRLQAEGVDVREGRVPMAASDDLDLTLWGPRRGL
jgi:methylated-DNA-protein-cysteine methyltransferase-like protein